MVFIDALQRRARGVIARLGGGPRQDGQWVQAPSKALTLLDWQWLPEEGEDKKGFANVNEKRGKKKCQGKEGSYLPCTPR